MFLHMVLAMTFLWFTKSGFNMLDKLWLQIFFFFLVWLGSFIRRAEACRIVLTLPLDLNLLS